MTDRVYSVFVVRRVLWHGISHTFRDKTQTGVVVLDLGRQIECPFLPWKGLSLDGLNLSDPEKSAATVIEDVVWNTRTRHFTVKVTPAVIRNPVEALPLYLEKALADEWAIRSLKGSFAEPDDVRLMPSPYSQWARSDLGSVPAAKRPKDFNKFVKAIVRHMTDDFPSQAVAYAIDRTGLILCAPPSDNTQDSRWLLWIKAMRAYEDMAEGDYLEWREKVDSYPELRDVVLPLLQDDDDDDDQDDDDDDDDTSHRPARHRRIPPPPLSAQPPSGE